MTYKGHTLTDDHAEGFWLARRAGVTVFVGSSADDLKAQIDEAANPPVEVNKTLLNGGEEETE